MFIDGNCRLTLLRNQTLRFQTLTNSKVLYFRNTFIFYRLDVRFYTPLLNCFAIFIYEGKKAPKPRTTLSNY